MYKLLIADDERIIRKGLRNSLNWNELNLEVIGEAEDGEEALELSKKLAPDVILLDICMPHLNGLEFIKKLKEINKNCIIIIISGYDEFQYMHEALKLKVFDYILKPVDKDNLRQVAVKAVQEISRIEKKKIYVEWASKQLNENLKVLQQSFFNNWFNGNLTYEQVVSNLKFLKINIENNIGIIVLRVIEKLNYEMYSKSWNEELRNFALINIACDVFKDFNNLLTYIDDTRNIVLITNIDDFAEWINLSKELENQIFSYLHYTVVIEQNVVTDGIASVKEAYLEMAGKINEAIKLKPVVLSAVKYIEANYSIRDLSLDMVAKKFNVSSSYLSKLLKQDLGLSFIDYLTNLRINKAICLMGDPLLKIYEIAELVGYSDQHYFCKAFKKLTGFSPIEYRRGH